MAAATDDRSEHDVFLKVSAAPGLDLEGLVNEAFAACIVTHLGLPLCEPLLVELTQEWIGAVPDHAVSETLQQSSSVGFGSVAAGEGWRSWIASDTVSPAQRAFALAIVAFDAFVENPDRRPSNPNLLIKASSLRAIDHEMAFRIRMLLPPPRPWAVGGLRRLTQPDGHVLALLLKCQCELDFASIRESWSGLSDDALAECAAAMPAEWAAATSAIADALTHLRTVRDRIDECLEELRRVLE
ncbi:MAG: HipA family kinase [Mycobacteriales bacterium]